MAQLDATWTNESVSHGTMRPRDLIPAFIDVLREADPKHALVTELDAVYHATQTLFEWFALNVDGQDALKDMSELLFEGSSADEFVEALFDALNDVAPVGCTFGAIEGDGSDYGFWLVDDEPEADEDDES